MSTRDIAASGPKSMSPVPPDVGWLNGSWWAHGPMRSAWPARSEEHTSELQSRQYLVCRLLLEKKNAVRSMDDLPLAQICSPPAILVSNGRAGFAPPPLPRDDTPSPSAPADRGRSRLRTPVTPL